MNRKTYRCVLSYQLGIPLFSTVASCSTCSRVLERDIYGDHVVSCVSVVGIKHQHNLVYDSPVNVCERARISAGKEVDTGLCGEHDKLLHLVELLIYIWDGRFDVCVNVTGHHPTVWVIGVNCRSCGS